VSHNHRIAYVGDGSPDTLQAELVAATRHRRT
jgi:hypothetical protein